MAPETLPPLDKLDPEQVWKPWSPTDKDPWGLKWAGHLYRRAAFGGSPAELRSAVRRGLPATLDLLFNGEPKAKALHGFLMGEGEKIARRNNAYELRGW